MARVAVGKGGEWSMAEAYDTDLVLPTGGDAAWFNRMDECFFDGDAAQSGAIDANDTLLRKFLCGPGVDQPVCMIEVQDANAAYYYHFDGLGSVVALSDEAGDTVQTYEYSIYGEPAASDPNHPNPFLFTARRFDGETGLYYYRARAYNPYVGRFLQTDPAGQGMNWYTYCGNNATNATDPSGQVMTYSFSKWTPEGGGRDWLRFSWKDDAPGGVSGSEDFQTIEGWLEWAEAGGWDTQWDQQRLTLVRTGYQVFPGNWGKGKPGWKLSGEDPSVFWALQALMWLETQYMPPLVEAIEGNTRGRSVDLKRVHIPGAVGPDAGGNGFVVGNHGADLVGHLTWNDATWMTGRGPTNRRWWGIRPLVALAHELWHAYLWAVQGLYAEADASDIASVLAWRANEVTAVKFENTVRRAFYDKTPHALWPRSGYHNLSVDLGSTIVGAWESYDIDNVVYWYTGQ